MSQERRGAAARPVTHRVRAFCPAARRGWRQRVVLFTRFHRIDLDVTELEVIRTLPLSDSSELPLRLRGTAALAGRVKASLAITGGIRAGVDVIKATMAGAHAAQVVSALLRHGPDHLRTVRREVESWMQENEWTSLNEMRGNMSLQRIRIPPPTSGRISGWLCAEAVSPPPGVLEDAGR